ncbi:hypothetical protein MRX96_056107 [Rhipicephalus microplus]
MGGASLSLKQMGALEHRRLFSRFTGRPDRTPGDLSSPLKGDLDQKRWHLSVGAAPAVCISMEVHWSVLKRPVSGCDKYQESRVDSGEPDSWPLDSSRSPSELVLLGACVQGSGGSLIRCGRLPSLGVLRTANGPRYSLPCGAESWVLGPEALMSVHSR